MYLTDITDVYNMTSASGGPQISILQVLKVLQIGILKGGQKNKAT